MIDNFNIHIYCYDDAEMFEQAVETIPNNIQVYAVDGRYADFEGDTNITPEIEEICNNEDNVEYHSPPDDMLPFGQGGDTTLRRSVHEKAKWVNHEVLPEDEWTMKFDTDERLEQFDSNFIDELEDVKAYYAKVKLDQLYETNHGSQPRIWKPKYWTFWINDCIIPREIASRDRSLEEIYYYWENNNLAKRKNQRWAITLPRKDNGDEYVIIQNVAAERDDDYIERRIDHLKKIERDDRAEVMESRHDET